MVFTPSRVFFEKDALQFPLGRALWERFQNGGFDVRLVASHNRVTGIPGRNPRESYAEAKKTLVFGVRRTLNFQTCKPSADYQLPLTTSCPGKCEYCYLLTSLPAKPYIRAYVNLEQILARAREYIVQHRPRVTTFEGSATSDPVPVERYTGALARTVGFFAAQQHGRFRFATKFDEIDSLLHLEHGGHTTIRFSLNIPEVIRSHEHGTPPLEARLQAAAKVAAAGYPLGFMIAPIILENEGARTAYRRLLEEIGVRFAGYRDLSFEFITHRFTPRAERRIREIFPKTSLPLTGEHRRFKFGQFGYGKFVYPPDLVADIRHDLLNQTRALLPQARIHYFI